MSPKDLVTIASYTDAIEANLAMGRLRAEGVEAVLADDQHIWANWAMSQALGGVKLRVLRRDIVEAQAIIAAHDTGSFALPSPLETCPACGSTEVGPPVLWRRLSLLSLFVFSVPLPWRSGMRCGRCGHSWKDG
ncbi:MAG: hypothetical protein AAGE01_17395 [Pseudomonadota bacterium]